MQARQNAFKPRRAVSWTKDRIELLSTAEVEQLRANADRLNETEIAALCSEVLGARPKANRKQR